MKRSRREFLQISALSLGALRAASRAAISSGSVSIIIDPADPIAASSACRWASDELRRVLQASGIRVGQFASLEHAPSKSLHIFAAGADWPLAATILKQAAASVPAEAESLALIPFSHNDGHGTLACGRDTRGLVYALLELADRVQYAENPLDALAQKAAMAERPVNKIRGLGRLFTSDIEDKPWFYDREMWPAYFSMLAAQRYNRFSLNFGIGYDFLDNVRDAYFLFAYPFLLDVPGYNVRAVNLPDSERDRNLEMLQFISSQAVARGLDFQLGIWTHGYKWGPASQPNYTIEGVTPENHAAYSRDALAALLKACPDISGITLRTHGESGVREGSYQFWQTVFSGAAQSGRKVNLDLHTKGLDQKLIDAAQSTGLPVILSPKYWAEHMGLPYQQASIRELEMPKETGNASFFALSSGSRSFTRYGYADFLREDRSYRVMFRIWPGTHRFLLWGDPRSTAAHARAFQFCGSEGVELFEPLSFKGREGSGLAGSRCGYADHALDPRWDWQKYSYTHRVWARLLYNAGTPPETWQRYLRKQFGHAALDVEAALASTTEVLPLVTTAHLPSAANAVFNPELYTNQSLINPAKPSPYNDTPKPKIFEFVSPLDPQLFSSIDEFVAGPLQGEASGKYSPIEVAQWLEDRANTAAQHLKDAETRVSKGSTEFRRIAIDIGIQIGLARFVAAELRAGTLFSIHEQSGDRSALEEALRKYRDARKVWNEFAEAAKGPYLSDITFGPMPFQRGHWLDRLSAIDLDVADMEKQLLTAARAGTTPETVRAAISQVLGRPVREHLHLQHAPPDRFTPGKAVEIALLTPQPGLRQIRLYYRHVNQAEHYESVEMREEANRFTAEIPEAYTDSKYPLQYYFEVFKKSGQANLYPGLGPDLNREPYFVIHSSESRMS